MQALLAQALLFLRGAWRYRWQALALSWLLALAGWAVVATLPDRFEARTQAVMLSRPNLEKVAKQTDMFLGAPTRLQQERVVDKLSSSISLTRGEQRGRQQQAGGTFVVSYEGSDPKQAQRVVQSLLDTFMEDSLGMKRTDSGVAQRFLESQLADYERRLVQAESRLADFKKANLGLMPGGEGDYYQRLESELGKLEQLQTRFRQVQDRRDELQRQLAGESPTFGLTGATSGNPIDSQIAAHQARIDQLLLNYTEKHPEVVSLRASIARLQEEKRGGARGGGAAVPGSVTTSDDLLAMSLDLNPVYQSMRISLSQAETELAELRGQISTQQQVATALRGRLDAIPEVEADLLRLTRDYEVNKRQYDELLQRLDSARISEQADQNTEDVKFRVIEPPVVPLTPSGPPRVILSALVLLGSIAAGLLLAFVLQQIRPVFSTRDALRQVTGLPVIGAVTVAIVEGFVPWYRRQVTLVTGALLALVAVFLLNVLLQDNVRAALRNLGG